MTLVALVGSISPILTGCVPDRWVSVEPGEYTVVHSGGTASQIAQREIQKLEVDRDKRVLVFTLTDSSKAIASFIARDRAEWPPGCPSNINSTRMEVLDIIENPLRIGAMTFSNPILVRDCPPEPMQVVLREDASQSSGGAIGGSGGACDHANECVFFEPGVPSSSSLNTPIPRSMKGYELYSWRAGQEWYFTLMTGTNRVKTYEEVTSDEKSMDVKLTVRGIEELKITLGQLPADAHIIWRGSQALDRIGMQPSDLMLPPRRVIEEIEAHCNEAGIQLEVVH
jgi:hypothetical protein